MTVAAAQSEKSILKQKLLLSILRTSSFHQQAFTCCHSPTFNIVQSRSLYRQSGKVANCETPLTTMQLKDFKEINVYELEKAVLKIKSRKSPGPDFIPGEVVRELFYANKNWLASLFNILIKYGIFLNHGRFQELL
ncbi:hypothetical protein CDAR_191341 [Caerostris darwini]|uniref:Uncharacterized protein n=1 Tax=Caerostris darwini TaxID=1538125 RepID=A0AAV4VET7_9ARAC|nr:hypothetical protein CDAR_191341 [Caerostris darwini]